MENHVVTLSRLHFRQWIFNSNLFFLKIMWVWTYDCSFIATRSGKTEAGRQDCIHIFSTRKDVFPKFTMQVFCSFLSIPMCGKSRKHSFNTEVIVDSSISRAWTPLIYLVKSNQSEVIPGAGIPERAVWRNDYRLRRPSSPQFPLVFFHVRAFSIQRTRISRTLHTVR